MAASTPARRVFPMEEGDATDRPTCQASGAPVHFGTWPSATRTTSSASDRGRPRPRSRPRGAVSPARIIPDLTGDDPAASRVATRQMAEINDAYAALTRVDAQGRGRASGASAATAPRSPGSRTSAAAGHHGRSRPDRSPAGST